MSDPADGPPPERLAEIASGALAQQPGWPVQINKLTAWCPGFEAQFTALPSPLDRDSTRAYCDAQSRDAEGVLATFIASQVWGYRGGGMGSGPYRLGQALGHSDLIPALQCAADELDAGQPVDAFEALCIVFDLPWVGTAFGSKYLFFADRQRKALVLDQFVGKWLREHTGQRFDLNSHVGAYARWLHLAQRWADELGTTPERVEQLIFTDGLSEDSGWR